MFKRKEKLEIIQCLSPASVFAFVTAFSVKPLNTATNVKKYANQL